MNIIIIIIIIINIINCLITIQLTCLYCMLREGYVPDAFRTGVIIPVIKNTGSVDNNLTYNS